MFFKKFLKNTNRKNLNYIVDTFQEFLAKKKGLTVKLSP